MILKNDTFEINMENDEIRVELFEVSGCEIDTKQSGRNGFLGRYSYGVELDKRKVKIEGYICSSLESNRRKLAKICTQGAPFYVIDGDYMLEVVGRKSPEYATEKRFSSKVLKFTLLLETTNPLWQGKDKKTAYFPTCGGTSNDENAIRISNEGDIEVGFELICDMRSSADKIRISKGGKYLEISGAGFKAGDKVFIDTRYGKKKVYVVKYDTGKTQDLLSFVTSGSTFFSLDVGENQIDYLVATGVLSANIYYNPAYMR